MTRLSRIGLALAGALALGACEYEDGDEGDSAGDAPASACEGETRIDDFAVGLTKEGTTLDVVVDEATPAMPIRDDNTWVLRVTDLEGTPLDDVQIAPRPWMPDHGHGSSVPTEVTPMGEGRYEIDPLNLFMAGLWEITFTVTDAQGEVNEVMIAVCVE